MNKKELLTTTEVIKQYGISHSTLWHWIKDNKITMYKKKGEPIISMRMILKD